MDRYGVELQPFDRYGRGITWKLRKASLFNVPTSLCLLNRMLPLSAVLAMTDHRADADQLRTASRVCFAIPRERQMCPGQPVAIVMIAVCLRHTVAKEYGW